LNYFRDWYYYKKYINDLLESENPPKYRQSVVGEIDGHFVGPKSFTWPKVIIPQAIYSEDIQNKKFRIYLKAKAALFDDKTNLYQIWEKIDNIKWKKYHSKSDIRSLKELLEKLEHEEKNRIMKKQAERITRACKNILLGLEDQTEENLPFNLFYMFNVSRPQGIRVYLDSLYKELKNN